MSSFSKTKINTYGAKTSQGCTYVHGDRIESKLVVFTEYTTCKARAKRRDALSMRTMEPSPTMVYMGYPLDDDISEAINGKPEG